MRWILHALLLDRAAFLLPSDLILNSLSVPLSLLLLLHVNMLSILLKVLSLRRLLSLHPLSSTGAIRRLVMHSIKSTVKAALFVTVYVLLC